MDKKILIVYYSRSGLTKKLAEAVAAEVKCDLEAIQDVRSRKGMFGWLRSGYEASRKRLPAIKPTLKDPSQYDLVVIGTPVWAGLMSSPVRTYLTGNKDKFKQVAFLVTLGGTNDADTLQGLEELCGKQPVATVAIRSPDLKSGKLSQDVKAFAARLGG